MSIASDAPAAPMPSVMQSALLRRKIRGRCARSSVSSAAGSYGKRRKVSITTRLLHHAKSEAAARGSHSKKASGEHQEILRVEAAMPGRATLGGISGMHRRTIVRGADHIGGIVNAGEASVTDHRRIIDSGFTAR